MTSTQFHWQHDDITPPLATAVGHVILQWAMIDPEVTKMLALFWARHHPSEHPPKPFNRRVAQLMRFAADLYADEPDEHLLFKWYIQRLRMASGKRDDIAHGIPGKITKGKRTFVGLMVPKPVGKTRFVPMMLKDITKLASELESFHLETIQVSTALWTAQAASSPDTRVWQDRGEWTLLTKDNRSPKLPRSNPLPPTFRG